jgi:quercetin dioxygenase-like cupin family protein
MTIRPKATIERQLHQTLQVFDFDQVAMRLRAEPAWHSGRNAITLRKAAGLQVVLIAMQMGNRLDEHQAAGPITLHLLSGKVRFGTPDQVVELTPQMALALDGGITHSVEALEESVFLLTLGDATAPDAPQAHATTINGSDTINEIIARYPQVMPVLQGFGLDLCCGGAQTLRAATARYDVRLDDVLAALETLATEAER